MNHRSVELLHISQITRLLYTIFRSFHSRKLHIFGFRDNIIVISSLVIFFFSLSGWASYHFCSLSLPWRLNSNINCIWNWRHRVMVHLKNGFKIHYNITILWCFSVKLHNVNNNIQLWTDSMVISQMEQLEVWLHYHLDDSISVKIFETIHILCCLIYLNTIILEVALLYKGFSFWQLIKTGTKFTWSLVEWESEIFNHIFIDNDYNHWLISFFEFGIVLLCVRLNTVSSKYTKY